MSSIYNAILTLAGLILTLIARIQVMVPGNGKFRKFAAGQQGLIETIQKETGDTGNLPALWIHASSLGEYGVARPIIRQLKKERKYRIILTFFSPTGYEALRWHHPDADHVFYLPLDTRRNVRRFLDTVQPRKAIFIISEYWLNYLSELKRRNIPTYLISAVISRNAPFFKWYGGIYRKSLEAFTHFMVLNEQSKANLRALGFENISITGDPLFDNAIAVSTTPWHNPVIERFARQGDLFIAGSISDKKDMALVSSLANNHRDVHFIIVPHEISEEILNEIKFCLDGYALCYSECDENTDFSDTQALIIDYLGDLAYLYRYGKWAYVGGGFTPYLHSIIEATVYGLPVAFGPLIHRKATPNELIELHIGGIVRSGKDLDEWFVKLQANGAELARIKKNSASLYRPEQRGYLTYHPIIGQIMKSRLLYGLAIGLLHLTALLPLRVLYIFSDGIYVLLYHCLHYRLQTVRRNLQRSFPAKSSGEIKDIERKFYRHLCDCIVETVKLLHISDKEIDRRIEVTNGELVDKLLESKRPIILFLGHYGNWEWAQAITRHYTRSVISGQIYRPVRSKVMDNIMLRIRSRFPTTSIPQKQAFRTLLRMNKEGQQSIIGFIADQRPNSSNLYYWTTFLHQETAYSTGGEAIGQRTGANYVYLDIEKTGRGHYRMTFRQIQPGCTETEYPYTLRFLQMLEATICRSPEYWLWSHKRWRFSKQDNSNTNLKKN